MHNWSTILIAPEVPGRQQYHFMSAVDIFHNHAAALGPSMKSKIDDVLLVELRSADALVRSRGCSAFRKVLGNLHRDKLAFLGVDAR